MVFLVQTTTKKDVLYNLSATWAKMFHVWKISQVEKQVESVGHQNCVWANFYANSSAFCCWKRNIEKIQRLALIKYKYSFFSSFSIDQKEFEWFSMMQKSNFYLQIIKPPILFFRKNDFTIIGNFAVRLYVPLHSTFTPPLKVWVCFSICKSDHALKPSQGFAHTGSLAREAIP